MTDWLAHVATAPVDGHAIPDVAAWRTLHRELGHDPVTRAAIGGFRADRVAWAFAAGYTAALARLVPTLADRIPAMCATEQGPVHPNTIATTVRDGRVTGKKSFVTLGEHADRLLVLASAGRDGERNALRLVLVARDAPGVQLHALPPLPVAPEIAHAEVTFADAPGEVLPGDGWTDYVKPFRTVEDVHVHLALLTHLVRIGRGAHPDHAERALALAVAAADLAARDPSSPAVHLALAGLIDHARALAEAWPWDAIGGDVAARWQRDRKLLDVASKARAARRDRARRA